MLVTTADAIEADLIHCLGDILVDTEQSYEPQTKTQGVKRRGNTVITNQGFHNLSKWFLDFLPELVER